MIMMDAVQLVKEKTSTNEQTLEQLVSLSENSLEETEYSNLNTKKSVMMAMKTLMMGAPKSDSSKLDGNALMSSTLLTLTEYPFEETESSKDMKPEMMALMMPLAEMIFEMDGLEAGTELTQEPTLPPSQTLHLPVSQTPLMESK